MTGRRKPVAYEHAEQAALMRWVRLQLEPQVPEAKFITAVPNGGERYAAVAARLKAEGVKAGVPDLLWLWPRGRHVGLAVEMKHGKNKPTEEQARWLLHLTRQRYLCAVAWDWELASHVFMGYSLLGPFSHNGPTYQIAPNVEGQLIVSSYEPDRWASWLSTFSNGAPIDR